ncbi:hypothetical protein HC891_15005 [Candidatus Gracilibacteria bacterium]|nr:hypothetical protein [Candidatus Gracilibacteria bacterium]
MNEPCIHDAANEAELLQESDTARELAYGINETRPNLDRYRRTFRRAGLRSELIACWLTYQMRARDMESWALEMQIATPADAPPLRDEAPDREIALRSAGLSTCCAHVAARGSWLLKNLAPSCPGQRKRPPLSRAGGSSSRVVRKPRTISRLSEADVLDYPIQTGSVKRDQARGPCGDLTPRALRITPHASRITAGCLAKPVPLSASSLLRDNDHSRGGKARV